MSEIDWSKAPEGATHATPRTKGLCAAFWRKVDGKWTDAWVQEDKNRDYWAHYEKPTGPRNTDIYARPTAEWTGTDLPPVGTVCECFIYDSMLKKWEWKIGELIYYNGNNEFAVKTGGTLRWCDQFRPRRTKEQIEAEEREKALQEIEELITGYSYGRCAEILYQAGYRKQGEGK